MTLILHFEPLTLFKVNNSWLIFAIFHVFGITVTSISSKWHYSNNLSQILLEFLNIKCGCNILLKSISQKSSLIPPNKRAGLISFFMGHQSLDFLRARNWLNHYPSLLKDWPQIYFSGQWVLLLLNQWYIACDLQE